MTVTVDELKGAPTRSKREQARSGGKTNRPSLPSGKVKKADLKNVSMPRRVDVEGSGANLDLTTFRGRLAHARLQADLTQDKLGQVLGYSRQAISNYEEGKSMPSIERIQALAERIGVSASYLAFGESIVSGKVIKTGHADPMTNVVQYIWSNGRFVKSSSIILPKDYATNLAQDAGRANLGAYRIDFDADHFGIRKGDRVFVNKKAEKLSNAYRKWLVVIDKNPQLVSYSPSTGADMALTLGDGSQITIAAKNVDVIGAVVASLCAT